MPHPEYTLLITRNQEKLFSYIVSLVGDPNDAWDILQETNIVLWKKKENFENGGNFDAWSFTIAKFQVLYFLQRSKRRKTQLLTEEIIEAMSHELLEVLDEREERLNALKYCISTLKEKNKNVLHHYYQKRQNIASVAALTGIKVSAIKQILVRSRQALFKCIEHKLHSPKPLK